MRRETLDWDLIPAYANHAWDGTRNPIKRICQDLAEWKWVGVESCTASGKTYLAAGLMFWFLECYENSLVITTAPKESQLTLNLWKEASKLYPAFARGELKSLMLRMRPPSNEWLALGFVSGYRVDEESTTKAQGFHAEHMLIIFEETPGVPKQTINAFMNTSTAPHNLILALGNPDHQLDTLHKFCEQDNVDAIRISGFDHPNVVLNDANFVPGAQSKPGIDRMLSRYGSAEHPLYLSRARGISPAQAQDALIRLEWCFQARDRWRVLEDTGLDKVDGLPSLGVDVANSFDGDRGCFAFGKGSTLLRIEDFPCPNSNELGHQVYHRMQEDAIRAEYVGVDGVGVGAGTVNTLIEHEAHVRNLIGAEKAIPSELTEEFGNLRAQMWWQLREDLRLGRVNLPHDEELYADLSTPKWFTRSGAIYVESKEDLKKRLGRSPNKGDACVYWNWVRADRRIEPIFFA